MGPANMATVNIRSLIMTDLWAFSVGFQVVLTEQCRAGEEAHAGTAGAMLDFSEALGVLPSPSSFSRMDFSLVMMRLDVMAEKARIGWLLDKVYVK